MQTHSYSQRANTQPSDRLVAYIQPRSWGESHQPKAQLDQPQPFHDFSHVDLFAHDPGPRSVPSIIQAKLAIGEPNDPYEQEVDRVAAQVVNTIHQPQGQPSVQRADLPDDDELQMKPASIQRTDLPDDDELQMKPASIQRADLPDDDELQMKPASIQRADLPDDDELQMKPDIQRADLPDDDELQMKPDIQRSDLPDDDELQMKPASIQRSDLPDDDELQMKPASIQRSDLPDDDELQMKPASIQRSDLPDDDELQMKPASIQREADGGGEASADLESGIASARGGGQALEPGLQRQMGQAMGADFSGVRVHTDGQADQLNRSIQARAFTTGQNVFFRTGEYQPGSRGGQELIAHELTHVVQQQEADSLSEPEMVRRALKPGKLNVVGELHNYNPVARSQEKQKVSQADSWEPGFLQRRGGIVRSISG